MATPEAFEGKPEGWKFTANLSGWLKKYTYGGIVEHHGYQMSSGGAWCLQEIEGENLPKSYRVKARRYRERCWRWLVLDSVVEIKDGWSYGANGPRSQ